MSEETPTVETTVAGKKFSYFFKTVVLKDETGAEIGEGRRHPTIEAIFPVPSWEEVVELGTTTEKVRSLLMDVVEDTIFKAGRAQINAYLEDNPEGVFTPSMFNLDKLTLSFLATVDKKSRGAWAPDKEEVTAFCKDYSATMLHIVKYDPNKVGTHVKNFEKGLIKLRNEKNILAKLREILLVYAANSTNIEEHQPVYDWFVNRINRWVMAEERVTVEAF